MLITFHPETASAGAASDEQFDELAAALRSIGAHHRMLVTLPNADTTGLRLRERWNDFLDDAPFATAVDSLGSVVYLSCMQHCAFMLGNTSSGYIEASWFPTTVVDLGERQTGRIVTPNIIRTPIEREAIVAAAREAAGRYTARRRSICTATGTQRRGSSPRSSAGPDEDQQRLHRRGIVLADRIARPDSGRHGVDPT